MESGSYTTIYHHGKLIGGMMGIASKAGSKTEALWFPSLQMRDGYRILSRQGQCPPDLWGGHRVGVRDEGR